MSNIIKEHMKSLKNDIKPGDTVKIYQIISDLNAEKEKIQVFEGIILARKHGKGVNATITVRKVIDGVGVEKIFPLHSPLIKQIELVKRAKVRRAKLYFLRKAKGKRARLKTEMMSEKIFEEKEPIKEESIEESAPDINEEKTTIKEDSPNKEENTPEEKTPEKDSAE